MVAIGKSTDIFYVQQLEDVVHSQPKFDIRCLWGHGVSIALIRAIGHEVSWEVKEVLVCIV
jgi:hypothetical protein